MHLIVDLSAVIVVKFFPVAMIESLNWICGALGGTAKKKKPDE